MSAKKKIENPTDAHVADMNIVAAALWETAEKQRFCGEFEQIMARWDKKLRLDIPRPVEKGRIKYYVMYNMEVDIPEDKTTPREREDYTRQKGIEFRDALNKAAIEGPEAVAKVIGEAKVKSAATYDYSTSVGTRNRY